jgi:hypothetical protein
MKKAKRHRRVPFALLRLRALRAPRRFLRAVRSLHETFVGVVPGAADISAANDPER